MEPQPHGPARAIKPQGPAQASPAEGPMHPSPSDRPTAGIDVDSEVDAMLGTKGAEDGSAPAKDGGLPQEQPQGIAADTAGSDRKIRTLQDMIDRLDAPETKEERRDRERRERSKRIVGAIGDGLRAMSNLYFTSQYAPDMYNHEKTSQLGAQNAAIERARKEREADADKYLRFAIALGDAENERAKTAREAEAERERMRLAGEEAARKAEAHAWLAALQPGKEREQAAKADRAWHEARTAKAEADGAPEMQRAKLETEKSRKGSYDASAGASKASAARSYASAAASRAAAERDVHHFNGKTYQKDTKDYEKDVREAARAYNERHGRWETVTGTDGEQRRQWVYEDGFKPIRYEDEVRTAHGSYVKPRPAETYAGEVEAALAKEREEQENRPPSRRAAQKDDNRPPSRQ